jgi:hypothetical protein
MKRFALLGLMSSLSLAACSTSQGHLHAVGSARAAITGVPPSVACVQLVAAAAGNNVTHAFDVTPGQDLVAQLDELPAGNVTVTAFAYQTSCASLASAHPNWASSATATNIVQGQVTSVSLTLEPVGAASVGVHFDVDAGVPPDMVVTGARLVSSNIGGFGAAKIGSPLFEQGLITNNGGQASKALTVTIDPANAAFSIISDNCSLRSLAPGDSCNLMVKFAPPTTNFFEAILTIGDGTSALNVTLWGSGITP